MLWVLTCVHNLSVISNLFTNWSFSGHRTSTWLKTTIRMTNTRIQYVQHVWIKPLRDSGELMVMLLFSVKHHADWNWTTCLNGSMVQWFNGWVVECLNCWRFEWLNGWMVEWLNGCMVEWLHGCMVECLHGWMLKWLNDRMVEWFNGWKVEWLNGLMVEWLNNGMV